MPSAANRERDNNELIRRRPTGEACKREEVEFPIRDLKEVEIEQGEEA